MYRSASRTRATLVAAIATTTIAACGSTPEVIDETPFARTAVVSSDIVNNGFKGFFANEGTQTTRTVSDKQRTDSGFKFTGSLIGRVSKRQDQSEIIRIDRNLEWSMDNRKKRYFECEIGGCQSIATFDEETFAGGEIDTDDDEAEDLCPLTTTTNRFEVRKTGRTREINGHPTEEYVTDWVYAASDPEGKVFENKIEAVVWTTPETAEIAEVKRVQSEFQAGLIAALDTQYPENFSQAIPGDALEVLARYMLANLSEADIDALMKLTGQTVRIEGYPISRKIEWLSKNDTCAAPADEEAREEDRLDTRSFKSLLSSVGKSIVNQEIEKKKAEKQREIAMAPVFSLTEEVTQIGMQDVRESQMNVPSNYKLQTRR